MKKIFKIIAIILICLWVFYTAWYYKRITYNDKIYQKNDAFIQKEIFSKDSENRGFSDEALKLMNEDLSLVNNDKDLTKIYILHEKSQRKIVLSKNKKEFTENFIRWTKLQSCIINIKIHKSPNIMFKNLTDFDKGEESKKIKDLIDYMSNVFTGNNTPEEDMKLMSSGPTKKECEDFLNE